MDQPSRATEFRKTRPEHFFFERCDWKRFREAVEARDQLVREAEERGETKYLPIQFSRKKGPRAAAASSDAQS